jgi:hypothetical protein
MPRHDRAYGVYHSSGQKHGTSKRTRVVRMGKGKRKVMGRNDGNTPKDNQPKPQAPKRPNK